MRKVLAVGIGVLAGLIGAPVTAQEKAPELLLRWHFAGTAALLQNEDLATYREVHNLPETARLRDEILGNFASKAAARFTRQQPNEPAAKASTALIKPLLQQLLESESRVTLSSSAPDQADWALAVQTRGETARLWSTNLWQLVEASRLGQPQAQADSDASGWAVQGEKYSLTFRAEGDWVLFAGGHSKSQVHERSLTQLRQALREPSENTLSLDLNLPAFAELLDREGLRHAPQLSLVSQPRADGFRTEVDLEYSQDLGIRPERWNVPKEIILDPLIGFTAVQGLKGKLNQHDGFAELGAEKTPNQLFIWAQSITPFSITAAADVGNPAEVVKRLSDKLQEEKSANIKRMGLGELRFNPEHHSLIWSGLPIIVPFARPASEPHSQFLTFGLFPVSNPGTNTAPAGLFAQLDKENLVYYAWEITGARMAQWRPLWQMSRFLRNKPIATSNSASEAWLPAIAPKLQNTITEATLENAKSVKIVRQSQLGFNALELVLIAHLADRYEAAAAVPSPAARPAPKKRPAPVAPPRQPSPKPR